MFDDIAARLLLPIFRETDQHSFSVPLCYSIYDLKDIYL